MPKNIKRLKLEPLPTSVNECVTQSEIFFQQSDYPNALRYLEQAIKLESPSPALLTNYGMVLAFCGDYENAVLHHQKALQIQPNMPDALANLGTAYFHQGHFALAEETLQRALALKPDTPTAHVSLGLIYLTTGRVKRAEQHFRGALQYDSTLSEAWSNLGVALQDQGYYDDATLAHLKAISLRPNFALAWSNYIMGSQYHPALSARQLKSDASRWNAFFSSTLTNIKQQSSKQKIHVAYVSADFYSHPVGYFIRGVLPEHDRDTFRVYAYSATTRIDSINQEIRQTVDHWRDIHNFDTAELSAQIEKDEIDILIDLSGHTSGNKLVEFNQRLAPVQLSWLGYFGTTGASNIDAVIIGEDQFPRGAQHFFTEKVRTIPRTHFSYKPPEYAPRVSEPPCLTRNKIRFGSFSNSAKLNNDVIMLWSRILGQVPNSELVLKWKTFADPDYRNLIANRFAQLGVDPVRLIIRPASPHHEMLAEYADIDIALDPFPFSGALTTCEALWMGVPVISYAWHRPVSRQGLAILNAIGCGEWVAYNADEYTEIACKLAADYSNLALLRQKMRERMRQSVLFDYQGLCTELEKIYLELTPKPINTTKSQDTDERVY